MPAPDTAVVLCGGKGTRAWPATAEVPKPMLSVGGIPALGHLLEIYARQGVTRFVLATGYLGSVIADWAATLDSGWDIICHDTGEDSNTGERIRRCAPLIDGPFFATYGDGLGNVDLSALWATHEAGATEGALASLTTVPLPSQYGTVDIDPDGRVERFNEKPVLRDHWINAGFFVIDPAAFASWAGPDLERDVLPDLAARGALRAHRHVGFWKSMDTAKDVADMASLAERAEGAPWLELPVRQG